MSLSVYRSVVIMTRTPAARHFEIVCATPGSSGSRSAIKPSKVRSLCIEPILVRLLYPVVPVATAAILYELLMRLSAVPRNTRRSSVVIL